MPNATRFLLDESHAGVGRGDAPALELTLATCGPGRRAADASREPGTAAIPSGKTTPKPRQAPGSRTRSTP